MADMTISEMINFISNLGVTLFMLILFVWLFIQRSKKDDERAKAAQMEAQEKSEKLLESARAREDMLIANAEKREAMLREEAQKREDMLRTASEKRESLLMLNMEKQLESMDAIAKSLNEINVRLDKMEQKIGRGV